MGETFRNTKIDVGATSVELSQEVSPEAMRKGIVITNTSTAGQFITIRIGGGDAVLWEGIILSPYGSWAETLDNRFTPAQTQITAIADAAGGRVSLHERQVT